MSTATLRRNFVFNLIYPIMRLAVAIVTAPIYVHHVGDARYGVISIVWILLGYFGFLDLGLSRASTNALSKLWDAPQPDRARVLLTTMTLNFCFRPSSDRSYSISVAAVCFSTCSPFPTP